MVNGKRLVFIPLLVMVIVFLCSGCDAVTGSGSTADEPGQLEISETITNAVAAVGEAESYKSEMTSRMVMTVTGSDANGTSDMTMNTTGTTDVVAGSCWMTYDISMSEDSVTGTEPQQVSMEIFMVDSSIYMGLDIPGMGVQWMKVAATPEITDAYDIGLVNTHLDTIGAVTSVELLRYETVDGERCMVLGITPNMDDILDWAGGQMPEELQSMSPEQISGMLDELEYNVWIGTDSSLLRKLTTVFRLTVDEEAFASLGDSHGATQVVMETDITMHIFDYNVPVSIVLPEEAKGAMELSPEEFLN